MNATITVSSLETCRDQITRGMSRERKDIFNFVFETATDVISEYCSDEENDQNVRGWFGDLLREGCGSGMVGRLIYCGDCRAWIDSAPLAFEELFDEILEQHGARNPSELFPGWCWWSGGHGDANSATIAWSVFEHVARHIASNLGIED